jgi:serine/threonine-protein kinase HipA
MTALTGHEQLYHKRCALELFGFSQAPSLDVSMADLEELALMQINQRLTLTGVQKKLSLSPAKESKTTRLTVVGLDGRFILKPSTPEYPEMAEIEHISMKLAELQKIPMAKCGLIHMNSGELAYITRRFDRVDDRKIQMEDFCQLSEKPTEKKYNASSESLGKVVDKYSDQAPDDKLTLFQVLLFSFWIGNADMHLKNFSLWRDPKSNRVRMSPGYDFLSTRLLMTAKEDPEEMALSINGKKNKLQWTDFAALGANLKIPAKVVERVRDQMLDSFFEAEELIEKSFLSETKKEEFMDLLRARSKRLAEQ